MLNLTMRIINDLEERLLEQSRPSIELVGLPARADITIQGSILDAPFAFDVERWMFDVGRSSVKTKPPGRNMACKHEENKLALMGRGSG